MNGLKAVANIEGLKVKHTPINRTEQFRKSTEAGRAGLYADSPFNLASAKDNAYRDGVDRTIEVIEPLLVERDELLKACKRAEARIVELTLKSYASEQASYESLGIIRDAMAKAEGRKA